MSVPNNLPTETAPISDTESTLSMRQFIEELQKRDRPLPLPSLKRLLSSLAVTECELAPLLNFDDLAYQRNLVANSQHFEVLLLCFEAGQRTPIHDHAGSACGVKVLQGTATETQFEASNSGWLYATGSMELAEGGVVGSVDMDVHQLSNLQSADGRLVTLHVYSPPLGEVGNYSITNNSVVQTKARTNQHRTP